MGKYVCDNIVAALIVLPEYSCCALSGVDNYFPDFLHTPK